jgi:hypothetical protein
VEGQPGRLRIAGQAAHEGDDADGDQAETDREERLGQDARIGAFASRCSGAHWTPPN